MKDKSITLRTKVAYNENTMQNPRVIKNKVAESHFQLLPEYHPEVKSSIQRKRNAEPKGYWKKKWPKATFNERPGYHPEVKSSIQQEQNAEP